MSDSVNRYGRVGHVIVDLQAGIVSLPAAHPVDVIIRNTRDLANRLRAKGHVIAWVTIDFSPDGGDLIRRRTDVPGPPPPPLGFATLANELGAQSDDVHVTKHTWNCFHATDLELQLRRRGVETVILSGIATSIGVESTARGAFDRDFDVVVAADTVTDPVAAAHDHSLRYIIPRLGRVRDIAVLSKDLAL